MPPQRRRPAQGPPPPGRRPRVAGLRNRPGHPDPATESAAERTTEQPAIVDEPGTAPEPPAAPEEERESHSGVLDGVLGQAPRPAPRRGAEETADTEDDLAEQRSAAAANEPPPVTDDADTDLDDDTDADEPRPARKPRPTPVTRAGLRPAGKRRATGAARPDDLTEAETETGTERRARHARAEEAPVRTQAQRQLSVAIVLVVVAVVLAGLAVWFRGEADDLTSGDSNTALTDTAATSQLKGQLTTAIKQTFSYNYTDLGSTERAVKENLTGKALCEYNLLFGEVKQYAPQQKIVLDTTVREMGVVRIDGDRAEALVYIDQLSTRVDVNKTVAVGGQFAVQAHRQGDHWKITEFDMFGQPLFNGKPAPKC